MTSNLSREATELVDHGRRALRPTAMDKARVYAALQGRLTPVGQPEPPPPAGGSTALGKLIAFTTGLVATVALVAVYRSRPSEPPAAPEPAVEASKSEVTGTAPTAVTEAVAAENSARADDVASSPAKPVARSTVGDRLAEEAALLTRAEKAFHSGNLKGALALVDEHRKKFPKGALVQERVNLRMQVLCGLGRDGEAQSEQSRLKRIAPERGAMAVNACRRSN